VPVPDSPINVDDAIWAPFLAAGLVCFITLAGARFFLWLRSREYVRERINRAAREAASNGDGMPGDLPSHLLNLAHLLEDDHRAAVVAQNTYARALLRTYICLLIAFTAVALAVTVCRRSEMARFVLVWVDVFALAWVPLHFRAGEKANRNWLSLRVRAELLRQYEFLYVLFPLPSSGGGITRAYDDEARRIEREVVRPIPGSELADRLLTFWKKKRSVLRGQALPETTLLTEKLEFYIRFRARRQLRWFATVKERLLGGERRRRRVLRTMYGTTIAFAGTKLALHFCNCAPEWVTDVAAFALLTTTGFAGAMTGIYFSQNRRSLIHRYHAQERRISIWLDEVEAAYPNPNLAGNSAQAPDSTSTARLRDGFLAFEDLMVEELVDWLHISEHDAIELGP
jgi:hypothetical protein